jgi:1-hydroxycarotenoid 3,4-desaturase
MRSVFEQLFEDAGTSLSDRLTLLDSTVIARHAWTDGGLLDLYPNREQSRQSIAQFAGSDNAAGFDRFYAQSEKIHSALSSTFMAATKPNPLSLVGRVLRQHPPSS